MSIASIAWRVGGRLAADAIDVHGKEDPPGGGGAIGEEIVAQITSAGCNADRADRSSSADLGSPPRTAEPLIRVGGVLLLLSL